MAAKGVTRSSSVTQLPVIRPARGTATTSAYSTTPTTRNTGTETSRREGDYIIYSRNGVVTRREYSPLRATTKATTASGGTTSTYGRAPSTTSTTSTATNKAKTGGSTVPTVGGTTYPTGGGASTGGGGTSGGGNSLGLPGGTGAGTPDVGALYGYTSGLSPNDIMAGIQYPTRVLNDVLNTTASPTTTGMMNPWIDLAANPWALYLMNQGNARTDFESAPTQSDTYNFMANLLKNATTPGAGTPSFGQILANLATALSSADSPVYGSIFGDALGALGMDAPGSVLRNVAEALSGFGMTMNPLAASALESSMGLMQNDYLNSFNANNPQGMENPATYLLRRLGVSSNIPNVGPQATGGSALANQPNPFR